MAYAVPFFPRDSAYGRPIVQGHQSEGTHGHASGHQEQNKNDRKTQHRF